VSAPIFNREDFKHPADGWYQIEAAGEHPNRNAGVIQVIDDAATGAIVNRFNADAEAGKLRHGNEMLIDHEHFSDQPDKETRAYGWLQALQGRADGLYGKIKWTTTGKAAVDGGDYRFFSTEYAPEDLQPVKNKGANYVRPMRLDGLTLTNMNNNRGQKPITNRERESGRKAATGSAECSKAAGEKLRAMAEAEIAETKCSAVQAWTRVMNREKGLTGLASRNANEQPGIRAEDFATGVILNFSRRNCGGMSASQGLARAMRHFPALAKMLNRDADWKPLQDFEPAARCAYSKAAQSGGLDKLYNDLVNSNERRSRKEFVDEIRDLTTKYPDLGFDGRWEKLRDENPWLYWKFVLTFDPKNLPPEVEAAP
jgi:hypothetical protein